MICGENGNVACRGRRMSENTIVVAESTRCQSAADESKINPLADTGLAENGQNCHVQAANGKDCRFTQGLKTSREILRTGADRRCPDS